MQIKLIRIERGFVVLDMSGMPDTWPGDWYRSHTDFESPDRLYATQVTVYRSPYIPSVAVVHDPHRTEHWTRALYSDRDSILDRMTEYMDATDRARVEAWKEGLL